MFHANDTVFGPGSPRRRMLLGVPFDPIAAVDVPAALEALIAAGRQTTVFPVNVDTLNQAQKNRWLHDLLQTGDLIYADGAGIVLGARLLGWKELSERVTAADLIYDVCARWQDGRHSLYFLGGEDGVAEKAAAALRRRFPGVRILGTHHGFMSPDEERRVIAHINDLAPDVLLVGYGVPREHQLTVRHRSALPRVRVFWMVGALVTYVAGTVPRAPRWMCDSGFEWLFRLSLEPRAKWRRYLIGNPLYLGRIAKAALSGQRPCPPPGGAP